MLTATDVTLRRAAGPGRFERQRVRQLSRPRRSHRRRPRRADRAHDRALPRRDRRRGLRVEDPRARCARRPGRAPAGGRLPRRPRGDGDDRRGGRARRTASRSRPEVDACDDSTGAPAAQLTSESRRGSRRGRRGRRRASAPVGSRSCPAPSSPACGVARPSSSGAVAGSIARWSRPGPAPRSSAVSRYLQSDCTEMSRPILERSGLSRVTTTTPFVWQRPAIGRPDPAILLA